MSTNFRLEISESSATKVFTFLTLVEREERGRVRRRDHGSNLAGLETAPELIKLLTLNLFSRRLYKLHAKISGHDVEHI